MIENNKKKCPFQWNEFKHEFPDCCAENCMAYKDGKCLRLEKSSLPKYQPRVTKELVKRHMNANSPLELSKGFQKNSSVINCTYGDLYAFLNQECFKGMDLTGLCAASVLLKDLGEQLTIMDRDCISTLQCDNAKKNSNRPTVEELTYMKICIMNCQIQYSATNEVYKAAEKREALNKFKNKIKYLLGE